MLLASSEGISESMDKDSKRDSASANTFSQLPTYSTCIGYSINVASQPEIRADAFGSIEKATAARNGQFAAGLGAPAGRL